MKIHYDGKKTGVKQEVMITFWPLMNVIKIAPKLRPEVTNRQRDEKIDASDLIHALETDENQH